MTNFLSKIHVQLIVFFVEMGLGKTLMTIAVIMALFRKTRENRFIVLCPSSLVSNWSKEFDKWLGKASHVSFIDI